LNCRHESFFEILTFHERGNARPAKNMTFSGIETE
jgi:hypothetical protein